MAEWRLKAIQRSKKPPYLLVEWGREIDDCEDEECEHSVIDSKIVDLLHPESGFVAGAKVSCRLKEGNFPATIITAGTRTQCCVAQTEREKGAQENTDHNVEMDEGDEIEHEEEENSEHEEPQEKTKVKKVRAPRSKQTKLKPILPSNTGPKSKKKVSMKAMQVSSSEISADLLQKIQVPLDDVPGDMVTPQQYSTPLKKSDQREIGPSPTQSVDGLENGDDTTTKPSPTQSEVDGLKNDLVDDTTKPSPTQSEVDGLKNDLVDDTTKPLPTLSEGDGLKNDLVDDTTKPLPTLSEGDSLQHSTVDPVFSKHSTPPSTNLLSPPSSGSDMGQYDPQHYQSASGKQKYRRSESPPPLMKRPRDMAFQGTYQPYSQGGFRPRVQHHGYSGWMRTEDEDRQSIGSSYSCYSDPGVTGLRDLVLHLNSQTQASLASMNMSLQQISNEVISLKDCLRKPALKKKKSEEREKGHDHSNELQPASGAVLGNPVGPVRQRVVLTCVTQAQVLDAERCSNSHEKLAAALLSLLFSTTELAHGNCTKPVRGDIKQLNSERLWAIRCHIDYLYPTEDHQYEKRWTTILQKTLNPKCRQMRQKLL